MEESFVIWMALFLILFSSSVYPVSRDSPGCDKVLNKPKGVYELHCLNHIDGDIFSFESEDCDYFSYAGKKLCGLHVIYSGLADEIPTGNAFYAVQIIVRLNLSGNEYNTSPNLRNMIHLEYLNLSRNYLTTAKLYNINYELPKLIELDLSYNKINTIEVGRVNVFDKLRTLDLSHNDLVNVPNATFGDFSELLTLDLSHNLISTIGNFTFEGLKKLNSLYLSNNRISEINGAFFRFSSLQNLDLSHNRLSEIKFEDFEELEGLEVGRRNVFHNLRTLNLSHNDVVNIPKAPFGDFAALQTLDLSHNLINTIGILTFEGLKQLNSLYLSNNRISEISGAFFRFSRLQSLDLSHNRISEIKFKDFEKLQGLNYFNLTDNSILSIESTAFTNMYLLQTLKLGNNKLKDISQISFLNNIKLDYLDISHNELNLLPPHLFKEQNFVFFDIAGNNLKGALSKGTFEGLGNVSKLNLSNQQVTALEDNAFYGIGAIDSLYLNNNKLQIISDKTFINLTHLSTLDLSHNNLRELHFNTTDLINLQVLLLQHNMITRINHDNFQELQGLQLLDLSNNQLTAVVINLTDLFKLKKIILSHNFLKVISGNTFTNLKSLTDLQYLILSYNNIGEIEVGAFSNLIKVNTIDLSVNNLTFIQPGTFIDNEHLQILNVSHNYLTTISYGALAGLQNLKTLDLSYNNIKFIDSERFHEVASLNVLILDKNNIDFISSEEFFGTQLEEVSIGGNKIPCGMLVKFKKRVSFKISALNKYESNEENVDGITCTSETSYKTQSDMKATPRKIENKSVVPVQTVESNSHFLNNISQEVRKATNDYDAKFSTLLNFSTNIVKETANKTDQIVKLLEKNLTSINKKPVSKNVIVSAGSNVETPNSKVVKEKWLAQQPIYSNDKNVTESNQAEFTNICLGLILLVLVCFIMYKIFYNARKSFTSRSRRSSYSTRELQTSMETPKL